MFQDINVAKSAPFALLTISQKSIRKIHVFPHVFPHFGKLREIRRPFLCSDHEEWKPQISQQIV